MDGSPTPSPPSNGGRAFWLVSEKVDPWWNLALEARLGNAFYLRPAAALHHGTLLIDADPGKVQRYLNVSREKLASKGIDSVRSRVTNLKRKRRSSIGSRPWLIRRRIGSSSMSLTFSRPIRFPDNEG